MAIGLATVTVAWLIVNLLTGWTHFALLVNPKLSGGEEAASALTRFFGALVLVLFFAENEGWRLRWVAAGLVVLGLGHLTFGYLEPTIQNDPAELNESLYEALVTQILACALFVIGLVPRRSPRLRTWVPLVILACVPLAGYIYIFELLRDETWMPALTVLESAAETVEAGTPPEWLTVWHWIFSSIPLVLATTAAVGGIMRSRGSGGDVRRAPWWWLTPAIVLLAGAQLHEVFWPSGYAGRVLTTAEGLRLAFSVVVVVGGIIELWRIGSERATLLAAEEERRRRLEELAVMKADFSAMVAHELGSPLAAIRGYADMLAAPELEPDARSSALKAIRGEISALNTLVDDVRDAATGEREDFAVEPRPVSLETLLTEAAAFAATLPGGHELTVVRETGARVVRADAERIGQVLRNLLSNAAKYSPEGAPIQLRAVPGGGGRVRLEVADKGPGIDPGDIGRILEKFGRGKDAAGKKVAGVGLGLYLSRRIVSSHGCELEVRSTSGEGSVFAFELEVIEEGDEQ
ncbi:MAG TPA: HAMP domain-containing sensor histidine kinase [Rubrobacteraceae bacterium]|nr:HAMP domain-containing sensor histidine kinase [Rubrobacteraceae bacterium]